MPVSAAPSGRSSGSGFDWGIAAGAGAIALAVLAAGGVSINGRRHVRTQRG